MDGDALRSAKTVEGYRARRAENRPMNLRQLPPVWLWTHWRIVENEFPYDRIAAVHHMLVPERDFAEEDEMTLDELHELIDLKKLLAEEQVYDWMLINLPHKRSIPGLFHYHLIKLTSLTKF